MLCKERKHGLSELTATVIIIAVTLIAGAFLYALYFSGSAPTSGAASVAQSVVSSALGTQGNGFYSSPEVSVISVSCSNNNGACIILLMNTGQSAATAYTCTLGGASGVLFPDPASIPAGVETQVTCTTQSGQGSGAGVHVTGEIPLEDGSQLPFSGTWD